MCFVSITLLGIENVGCFLASLLWKRYFLKGKVNTKSVMSPERDEQMQKPDVDT